jgi:hypothetical protein
MAKLQILVLASASALVPAVSHAQAKACKMGTVVFGNPEFKPTGEVAKSGASAKSDPPLHWRTLTFSGNTVYTNTGQEVWAVDLSSGTQRLVAGQTQKNLPKFGEGKCADARFVNIQGMAALADGSVVVADHGAGSVLKIERPDDAAACAVSVLAGTNKKMDSVSSPPIGDKDGPVGASQLGYPHWPVTDAAGDVYFIDGNTTKVKKVTAGSPPSVTTLATLPRDSGIQTYRGMTILKDKLYATANSFSTGFIFEVDTKSGAVKKIVAAEGRHLPEIGQGLTANFSGITTDGKDLFVTGSGYIWRVTPAGKIAHVAGAGAPLEWPKGYDPKAAHPAKNLILRYRVGDQTAHGSTAAIGYHDGALWFRGKNFAPYVLRIDCK